MEKNNFDNSIIEDIQDYLERIKRSKQKMDNYNISKFYSKVSEIQKSYDDNEISFNRKYMDYIKDITEKINRHVEINKAIDESVSIYNEEFEKLSSLLKDELTELDSDALLTEEDIKAIREDYLNRKISISTAIIKLRDKIESLRREIVELEEQIDREDREFEYASSIGITKDEYKEMMDNLKSKELVETILSTKGVLDIAKQKVTERSQEDKDKLATIRNSIRDEIASAIARHEFKSILDTIQFLYNNDQKVERVEKPREISISKDDLNNITINITVNINVNPVKVAGKDKKDYVPNPAPKDMTPEPTEIVKTTEPEKSMKNEATLAELRETIETLESAIKSIRGLEQKNLPTGKVDLDGLVKLYNDRKAKLDELVKKAQEPKGLMKVEEHKEIVPVDTLKKDEISSAVDRIANERIDTDKKQWTDPIEEPKKEKTSNQVYGYYRQLSNSYDRLADERIKLIEQYGKDSKEVTKIDEKLKELAVKMQEALDLSHDKLEEELKSMTREEINKKYEGQEKGKYKLINEAITEGKDTVPGDITTYMTNETEKRPIFTDASAKAEGQIDGSSFRKLPKQPTPKPKPEPTPEPTPTPDPTPIESRRGLDDLYTIFIDVDNNNKAYVRKATFDRFFGRHENIEEQRIDGALCYAITDAERKYIEDNKDNETSPYDIRYVEVNLGKEEELDPEQITLYRAVDENGNIYATDIILKMFGITPNGESIRIYGNPCYKLSEDEEKEIINQVAASEEPPMTLRYVDVYLHEDTYDEVVLYRDLDDNNQVYASEEILRRFGITPSGDPVNIYGSPCYKISEDEDKEINNQAAASEDPKVIVKYEDIHLQKEETIILYRDLDDNEQVYASEAILRRFGITPTGPVTPINGEPCHKITPEEDEDINNQAKASEQPKINVEYQNVHLKTNEETVVIYKAVDEDDQLYTTKDVFDKFGLTAEGEPTEILGKQCYKVSPEQDKEINAQASASEDPIIHVVYKPVKIKKETKVPLHYQEVIQKLTKDLDIKKKDGKRYRASNIKVWQTFKDELHSGNYLYNILHFAPAVVKLGMNLIRKAAAKIMIGVRGRKVTKEINDRLNGKSENKELNLTDEDLEVLWQEYKGRNLRADMNNQINPIILAKLREYGLRKVEVLNNEIKQHYLAVIAASDEIEKLREQIPTIKDEKAKKEAIEKLNSLYKFAGESIRIIQDRRKKADDLLSNGVHGIEEDFKAVESKMNYVGLRFSKQNNFDNELQARLADAGHRINEGIATQNDQELFEAFIDYEKIYYENTEVKGSIVGKRSTGKKWYSPHAELMDYRDDPLIRDLFTTIATVSAAISIANGIVTHLVKDQQFQQQVNGNIAATNKANMQYHNAVQTEVGKIQGQHQAEIEGLQAQMYRDVGYGFNTGERGILDQTGWSFNGTYHANDAILHSESQNLITTTQSQISSLAQRASSGALTETQYIDQLASNAGNLSTTVNNALQPLYQASKAYAQGHPFAYDATLVPMEWFAQHPNAFVDLGNAISVINHSADAMALLSPTMMQTIGSLPSDLATTLAAGISSLALVRSAISSAKGKTTAKNSDKRKTTDEGKAFGERIMGEKSDKELEEMMDDDDKEAENEDEKGNSK